MNDRVILSLCDLSGEWPRPYREAGYDVRRIDLSDGQDVRLLLYPGRVHGILAAPPCTVFSNAGNRVVRSPAQLAEALSVVDACLRLVVACRPAWWALENPVGKLRRYLGAPAMIFDPWQFGDGWTKKTLLWGNFAKPVPGSLFTSTRPVAPTCSRAKQLRGVSPSDSPAVQARSRARRSVTPAGFARAFFEVNP